MQLFDFPQNLHKFDDNFKEKSHKIEDSFMEKQHKFEDKKKRWGRTGQRNLTLH